MRDPRRIVVVPAAWDEAFWWFDNQADNVPSILRSIKQTYNVDDNRVYLTGVSDGGTGSYFFAFMQPTEWAAFLPPVVAAAGDRPVYLVLYGEGQVPADLAASWAREVAAAPDPAEGVAAFVERRAPNFTWTGRTTE